MDQKLEIRDIQPADEAVWRELWAAYLQFYETTLPNATTESTWERILDPKYPFGTIVADQGGRVIGFANFVLHPFPWSETPACLLHDLFVRPDVRGNGAGRALIQHLIDRGKKEGWDRVYWLTKEDNATARRLYDTFAPADGFIRYRIPLGATSGASPSVASEQDWGVVETDRALGETVAWRPVRPPSRAILPGDRIRLEPLDPERHGDALFAAQGSGADPRLWTYMPSGPYHDETAFRHYLDESASSDDPVFFAIVDDASGIANGVAAFLRLDPAHGVIEIGHIWFGASLQRTPAATEAIFLLARHAFDDHGYRRLEWKCDALNARSRRAAERFGFQYEGTFRQHRVVKGRNRDTAWYAIVDRDWPAVRAAFTAWLDPANFDRDGTQRRSLGELRESLGSRTAG